MLIAPTDAETKSRHDAVLFTRHMVPVSVSIIERTEPVMSAQRKLRAQMARTQAQRHHHREGTGSGGVQQVARIFAHSLRWVDRLYADVDNSANEAMANAEGLGSVVPFADGAGALQRANGAAVEFALEQHITGRRATVVQAPTLAMRVLETDQHLASSIVLSDLQGDAAFGELRQRNFTRLSPFVRIRLREFRDALVAVSERVDISRDKKQIAESKRALAAVTRLDEAASRVSLDGTTFAEALNFGSIGALRMVMRVAWNLVNRRLRLDTLPPVQAAHVIVDVLTGGGDGTKLRSLMAGEEQYIVGVGHVSNEVYDNYMRSTESWRTSAIGRHLPSEAGALMVGSPQRVINSRVRREFSPELVHLRAVRESARRQASASESASETREQRALGGSTTYGRWLKRRRAKLLKPRINFRHRARHLLAHGVHHLDRHTFALAGKAWHAHRLAMHAASVNGTDLHRMQVAALASTELSASSFWVSLLDTVIALFGGNPATIADAGDNFIENVRITVTNLIDDIVGNLSDLYDRAVLSAPCDVAQDVDPGGTGQYSLLCFPLLPRRLFAWYVQFPNARGEQYPNPDKPRFGGFLNFYMGPGFQQWPEDMLAPGGECPILRDPDQVLGTVSLLSEPITFVATYEQTNMCRIPAVAASPAHPLCATINCDFCERSWLNSEDLGFTDGVRNIEVYSQAFRYSQRFVWLPVGADGFIFVVALFVFIYFREYLPLTIAVFGLFISIAIVLGELYVRQEPERALYAFTTIALSGFIAGGMPYIVFVLYVLNMFQVYAGFSANTWFGDWLVNTLLPVLSADYLLGLALKWVARPVAFLFVLVIDLRPSIDALIARLAASVATGGPTTTHVIHSVLSVGNLIQLAFFVWLALRFGVPALRVLFAVVSTLTKFVANLFRIYVVRRDFFVRRNVSELKDDAEEAEDDRDSLVARVAALERDTSQHAEVAEAVDESLERELGNVRRRQAQLQQKID